MRAKLTRWDMSREASERLYRYVELAELCKELCDCIESVMQSWFQFAPLDRERLSSLRNEWFEAATSARELALEIWPDAEWMHRREIPWQVEAARTALRIRSQYPVLGLPYGAAN